MSRTEIASKLNQRPEDISRMLNKMIKYGEILFEELDKELAKKYSPNIKRRMRLYKLNLN